MTISHETTVSLAATAYSDAYSTHGDIDLDHERFEKCLDLVIEKHLGPAAALSAKLKFLGSLHTTDLYLVAGCAQLSERAWQRFANVYQEHIRKIARFAARTSDLRYELANSVMADLFMPDKSGRSRIASYDGRESLSAWLRAVITHRAIDQGMLKWNSFDSIDGVGEIVDNTGSRVIDAAIRAGRYESMVQDAYERAIQSLTDRERLVLVLRYEDGLRVYEVAEVLGIHPSGVTRQLKQICIKLEKKIISILAMKHHLGRAAIEECVLDALENSAHSLLGFLKGSQFEQSADMLQS